MAWLAGVDGCPGGWFRACRETGTGELRFDLLERIEGVFRAPPAPAVVALDMPIGLPPSGPRECDGLARGLLGPRRSSVFRAPIRPALHAASRDEADALTRAIEGKGVAAQAFGLYAKVRAVDAFLASDATARERVFEVHPELSFCFWNDSQPMRFGKKQAEGKAERLALVRRWLGADVLEVARGGHPKKALADDDVLDALAALWTAHRIAAGSCRVLPSSPPMDEAGLPMRIVV